MLSKIDALLNRFTMYKVVLYGLCTLLVVSDILAWTGNLDIIGPLGLVVSAVVLAGVCWVSNILFARIFKASASSESYIITAVILALILPTPTSLSRTLLIALTGVIAMATKYLLVWRGSHIFNPAAAAAFIMSITGWLAAIWWVATPILLPFTILLALIVLRKQRKFSLYFAFAIPAFLMLVFIGSGFHDQSIVSVLHTGVTSWPIIFMGSIMLTEPSTLPPTRYYQVLVGILVGVVFSCQLHVGIVTSTPQTALLLGNLLTLLATPAIGAMVKLKQLNQLTPNIFELIFERPRQLAFVPGQYLEWTVPHKNTDIRGNRRTFSIASSPAENELHVGIKTYEPSSSFKRAFTQLKPGDRVRVAHVAGNFTLDRASNRPLVFIAGGIGITPFRSMLGYLTEQAKTCDATLYYVAANEADFVFKDVIQQAETIGLKTRYVVGRLQPDALQGDIEKLKQSTVYISGPDAMVSGTKKMLRSLGVPSGNIRTDHFTGY